MTKKYKIKDEHINDYPHLKGIVFDEDDITVCIDIMSIYTDIETADKFEKMDWKEKCEFIGENADYCGRLVYVDSTEKYEYTEFGGIDEFEEV